jgi:hypothetical protein
MSLSRIIFSNCATNWGEMVGLFSKFFIKTQKIYQRKKVNGILLNFVAVQKLQDVMYAALPNYFFS